MAIRYYLMPLETKDGRRGPKYIAGRHNPTTPLVDCRFSAKDYGRLDYGIVCADVTGVQHTLLAAELDVSAVPLNLDNTLNAAQVTTTQLALENANIPAGWVSAGMTWREVLRTLVGMFLYMQRLTTLSGQSPFSAGATLDTQVANIPQNWRDWMRQSADDLQLDYGAVTGSTTLRQIFKGMADQFAGRTFYFGLAEL